MLFDLPKSERSIIKVVGVGGGGSNAVEHMFNQGIKGVDFVVCNTDNQALNASSVPVRIQLGPHLTEGMGAGSKPEIGKQACIESIEDVRMFLDDGTKMLFITAGMGGGTGTGAAPIIAKAAKEMDILTVAIVTLPFKFEGSRRHRQGIEGLEELKNNVDSILVISNDKLRQVHGNLGLSRAFAEADNVLTTAAKGIAEIITVPGYINVDFEDVSTVMRDSGVAIMGSALAEGDDRAKQAVVAALNSPLLEDNDIRGAQHILLNISSGTREVTMDEVCEITEYVQDEAGHGTDLIWGNCKDESLGDNLSLTIIATGFNETSTKSYKEEKKPVRVTLEDRLNAAKENDAISVGLDQGEETRTIDLSIPAKAKVPLTEPTLGRSKYGASQEPYEKKEETKPPVVRTGKSNEIKTPRTVPAPTTPATNQRSLEDPRSINDMENEPAYKRKRIDLEASEADNGLDYSRYTVSVDEDNPIKRNNQFLHDNVD